MSNVTRKSSQIIFILSVIFGTVSCQSKMTNKNNLEVDISKKLEMYSAFSRDLIVRKKIEGIFFRRLYRFVGHGEDIKNGFIVPNVPDFVFGWRLLIKSEERIESLKLKVVVTSEKPINWIQYDKNGNEIKQTYTNRYEDEIDFEYFQNSVFGGHSIIKGEPAQSYDFKLYYKGILLTEFDIDVMQVEQFLENN